MSTAAVSAVVVALLLITVIGWLLLPTDRGHPDVGAAPRDSQPSLVSTSSAAREPGDLTTLSAGGATALPVAIAPDPGADGSEVQLLALIHGRVLSVDGSPIPDATVTTLAGGNDLPTALSGVDGCWSLQLTEASRSVGVMATCRGYASERIQFTTPTFAGQQAIEFRLRRSAHISGFVFADDGTPVPGAELTVEPGAPVPDNAFIREPLARATSNSEGAFELELGRGQVVRVTTLSDSFEAHAPAVRQLTDEPEQRWSLTLPAPGALLVTIEVDPQRHADVPARALERMNVMAMMATGIDRAQVSAGDQITLTLPTLPDLYDIEFHPIDEFGRPVPVMLIEVWDENSEAFCMVLGTIDGRCATRLSSGRHLVRARPLVGLTSEVQTIVVPPANPDGVIELLLSNAGALGGRVVPPPERDTVLELLVQNADAPGWCSAPALQVVARDGSFSVPSLAPGRKQLTLWARDGAGLATLVAERWTMVLPGSETELEIARGRPAGGREVSISTTLTGSSGLWIAPTSGGPGFWCFPFAGLPDRRRLAPGDYESTSMVSLNREDSSPRPSTTLPPMRHRTLGSTDLSLPVITFGAWALGGGYWGEQDDSASVAAIRAALDAGIDAIDTAPVYGLGRSETIIGRAIADRRDEVTVLTKVGLRWDCPDGERFVTGKLPDGRPLQIHKNSRPESVRLEVERSLRRLGVERLDLVQVHWPDPTTPIAETMGALAELRAEGKLREIGVSNYDVEQLTRAREALGDVPLASDQPIYSLVQRGIEDDVLPWARTHAVGLIVYSPLEQGLLTGKVRAERTFGDDEGRSRRTSFNTENRAAVNTLLDEVLVPIAANHESTLAQTVLAWTVQQPGITVALAGARKPEQARENAAAGDLELTADEWSAIDQAFAALTLREPASP